jgi:tape measure domain-containing protein
MAIEVGALVAAIEADATQAIAEVRRYQNVAKSAAASIAGLEANTRSALKSAAAVEARQLGVAQAVNQQRDAKKRLTEAQRQYNASIAVMEQRLANGLTVTRDMDRTASRHYKSVIAAENELATAMRATATARVAKRTEETVQRQHEKRSAKERQQHEAGLGKAQVAARRAETTAFGEEARRRSEIQRDIDRRVGADRNRLTKVDLSHRQTMYNELFRQEANALQAQHEGEAKRRKRFLAEREASEKATEARILADKQRLRGVERASYESWWKGAIAQRATTESQGIGKTQRLERQRNQEARVAERQRLAAIRQREAAELRASRAMRGPGIGGGIGLSTLGVTGTLAGTMAVGGFLSAANDFQVLQQRLKQVTENSTQVKVLFNELSESANRLRVPVAGMTELFVKLRQSNQMLGLSYGETKQVTDAFSASLRISGATGQTAASALLQFGQAMAKGTLDGDEFRTVAENASEVLRVLERQLGKNRGELLKMREEGKLTARMMADALIKESVELQKRVAELPPTLGQATASFRNSVIRMIGDSQDLQKAMDNIAMFIVRMGDLLQENSPLIVGIGKWATGLFAVKVALQGIDSIVKGSLALRALFGVAGGTVLGVAAVGAAGASVGFFAEDMRKAKDQADARKRVNEQAKKDIEQQGRDILAAKARFDAAYAKKLEVSKTTGFVGDRVQIERDANEARAHLDELTQAYTRTATAKKVLDSGGTDVSTTTPGTGGESKAAKDTTDEFLRSMESVTAAGLQTAAQMARLRAILADTNKVIGDGAAPAEALAQALERNAAVGNLFGNVIGSVTPEIDEQVSSIDLLLENYELLVELGLNTADQSQLIEQMYEEQKEAVLKLAKGTLEYYEALKKLAALEKLMRADAKTGADKPASDGPMDNAERRSARLKRQLFEIVSAAPGQLMVDFFGAIGDQIDEGADSVADQMRRAFGNIFGNIGQVLIQGGMDKLINSDVFKEIGDVLIASLGNMMAKMGIATSVFGKFLLKIKAALSNPLVAGFAMVALGAAMVAYGRRMGGIGRGGSGDLGGTLGGLGVGAQPTPGGMSMPTFGPGPMFPNAAQSAPSSAVAPMTVNATIIGPNDPQAQRQIAQLIDNAARRGLTSGGGMRT